MSRVYPQFPPTAIRAEQNLLGKLIHTGAIELETLADHHDAMATGMRRGDSGAADLMEARAAELRRWAAQARAGA